MFNFGGNKGHKATITFTPDPRASLERRIKRAARVKVSIEKAVKRGDVSKAGQLQAELSMLTDDLLQEKQAIEEMLRSE